MSLYSKRGVSAQKEEVHAATKNLDKGLYANAFCKIYPDVLCGDPDWVNLMHADGAGTKSILAYLYWKETGDVSVWKGIAQDAIVMNLDDLLCVGIYDQLLFSSTIDRNKNVIPAEVLEAVINGTQAFFDTMKGFGVNITFMGGETADVGDVVRSIAVNGTMAARWPKSILAYLYWKETGDVSVWKGIAQDAIVMNLDDLLCVGIYDQLLFSSTIDRNKNVIPAEVLEAVINGTQAFFDTMKGFGVNITFMGGETADVGDVVRSIAVNGTMAARWPKSKLITNEKIKAGDVIVGLAGFGQANYETEYNSGLASNGLTSARHDVLHKTYGARFPESYDTSLDESVVYIGPHRMTDEVKDGDRVHQVGKLLLSPTRTFAPVMKALLENHFDAIHGLIHCSGGGQTKCMKYIPDNVRIVKDNLFTPPVIFNIIQAASKSDDREMYQVFNMGTRLEIYTNEKDAEAIISVSKSFGVDAQVIGRVEASEKKELQIATPNGLLQY